MNTFKEQTPLVDAAKGHLPISTANDEVGYTGIVGPGTGGYILGSALKKGRKYLATFQHAAGSGAPTGLQVGLGKADDANGTNVAFVTGALAEKANPVAGTMELEIDPSIIDAAPTKYFGIIAAVKGAGTTTLLVSGTLRVLDPDYAG
jgi:hypothetical protein